MGKHHEYFNRHFYDTHQTYQHPIKRQILKIIITTEDLHTNLQRHFHVKTVRLMFSKEKKDNRSRH